MKEYDEQQDSSSSSSRTAGQQQQGKQQQAQRRKEKGGLKYLELEGLPLVQRSLCPKQCHNPTTEEEKEVMEEEEGALCQGTVCAK